MKKHHTHPCWRCQARVECDDALLERNHDGWPEIICAMYHRDGGVTENVECETCQGTDWCAHCNGAEAVEEFRAEALCEACAKDARENEDPTPYELPSGSSVGPETRDAEAWQIKRGR